MFTCERIGGSQGLRLGCSFSFVFLLVVPQWRVGRWSPTARCALIDAGVIWNNKPGLRALRFGEGVELYSEHAGASEGLIGWVECL